MRSLPLALEEEITKEAQYGAYLLQIDFDPVLRYTSLDISLRYNALTWTPRQFQFASVDTALSDEIDKMDLTLDNTNHSLTSAFHGQAVRRKLVWLWYVGLSYPATPIGASLVFNGQIDGVEIDQSNIKIDVESALAYWRRKVPGRIYQATCPWVYETLLGVTDQRFGKYCRHVSPERAPDPNFLNAALWTYATPPWSIHDGAAWKAAGVNGNLQTDCSAVAGEVFTVTFTLDQISGASASIRPTIGGTAGTARTAPGTYTEVLTGTTTGDLIFSPFNVGTVCKISNVSVTVRWCDQTYKRCSDLSNEDNFGGFRYLPYLLNRTFKWGPEKM